MSFENPSGVQTRPSEVCFERRVCHPFFGNGYVRVAYLNGANGTLLLGGFPLACVAKLSFDWIPIPSLCLGLDYIAFFVMGIDDNT